MEGYSLLISCCCAFISVILGLAYSILSQGVIELEEKYGSSAIIDCFKPFKDHIRKTLYGTTAIIFCCLFVSSSLFLYRDLIENAIFQSLQFFVSSIILSATIYLIIEYCDYVKIKNIFGSPINLYNWVIQDFADEDGHHRAYGNNSASLEILDENKWLIVEDLLFYAIIRNYKDISRKLTQFFYEEFYNYREICESQHIHVEYPPYFYNFIRRIVRELVTTNTQYSNIELLNLESIAINGTLLIGEDYTGTTVSDKTYQNIWNNLLLVLKQERTDLIKSYWDFAFQYAWLKYDSYKEDIDEEAKNRFFEFNILIGALLLYMKKYEVLKYILHHTNSEPPKYSLFPSGTNDFIEKFASFRCNNMIHNQHLFMYQFPEVDFVKSLDTVNSFACKYLALVFIKMYNAPSYYVYDHYKELPHFPDNNRTIAAWGEAIQYLKYLVMNFWLEESSPLEKLISNFKEYIDNKDSILEYIDRILSELHVQEEKIGKEQQLSDIKVNEFKQSSIRLIGRVLSEMRSYSNPVVNVDLSNVCKYRVTGVVQIVDKGIFADDQKITHLNADSIYGQLVANDISSAYSLALAKNIVKSYSLKDEELWQGVDKIIAGMPQEWLIVACRINLKYYTDILKIPGLAENSYNGTDIFSFWNCDQRLHQILLLVRKSELPALEFLTPNIENVPLDVLDLYIEKDQLYGNIIDLNKNENIRKTIVNGSDDDKLRRQALLVLAMNLQFYMSKDSKIIAIKIFNRFGNNFPINKIEDISSI